MNYLKNCTSCQKILIALIIVGGLAWALSLIVLGNKTDRYQDNDNTQSTTEEVQFNN